MLSVAILAIFIRSCYRVAELESGFGGKLANEEIPFMILEGSMITIATIALSIVHPGMIFRERWSSLTKKNTLGAVKSENIIEK